MGPPCPPTVPNPPANRYNRAGRPALYMCDSEAGVHRELARDLERLGCGSLVLQGYELDLGALRLADLSSPDLDNYIQVVFDIAESCDVEGRVGPRDCDFSRAVAELVADAGFDGMLVPGVRGEPKHHYRNVVIFHPCEAWRGWSTRERGFRRVAPIPDDTVE
jgi:RES domain-containing protein